MVETLLKRTMVSSVAREKLAGGLPPFMEDTRNNSLMSISTPDGKVYIKPVATPYSERHLLIVPDSEDQHNMPGILDVPPKQLQILLSTTGKLAEFAMSDPEVRQVDIGINSSKNEPDKVIASVRHNLHVHVNAMTQEDLSRPVPELRSDKSLRSEVREPMRRLANEIMEKTVYETLQGNEDFERLFERVEDRNRITFRLKNGLSAFKDEDFTALLVHMHKQVFDAYKDLGCCFFTQGKGGAFAIRNEDNRYELRDKDERLWRVGSYMANHPDLSDKTEKTLNFLAKKAKQTLSHQDVTDKMNRSSYMVNGPAFSTVITGVKNDVGEVEWRMGIDAAVFSSRDFLQASRGTEILFRRDPDKSFDAKTLARVKRWEKGAVKYVKDKNLTSF